VGKLDDLSRKVPTPAKAAAALALAWGAMLGLPGICARLGAIVYELASSRGWVEGTLTSTMQEMTGSTVTFGWVLVRLLVAVTFALPFALLTRMVARNRVRAGLADPLDRARAWTTAHPRATRALRALPSLWWLKAMAEAADSFTGHWGHYFGLTNQMTRVESLLHLVATHGGLTAGLASVIAGGAALLYRATGPAVRAFLAPTMDLREKDDGVAPTSDRRVGFDAVAVTPETRAAVALMAAMPVLTFVAMRAARLGDAGTEVALAAYASIAVAGAVAFRRASRIAIGVDGIFVTGTSRSRFFPYRDVDTVRANGTDIEVLRKDRVLLRLQLHGEDATQKDAIIARMQEAADAAKQRRTAAVGEIVAAASEEKLARLAEGGGQGYRSPSVTKEQLWSLVGAPEPEAAVRTAAARALVNGGNERERARLRVAARECAQPGVRVALMELAGHDDGEEDEAPGKAARLTR
jgi:hypothetical protein